MKYIPKATKFRNEREDDTSFSSIYCASKIYYSDKQLIGQKTQNTCELFGNPSCTVFSFVFEIKSSINIRLSFKPQWQFLSLLHLLFILVEIIISWVVKGKHLLRWVRQKWTSGLPKAKKKNNFCPIASNY